MAQFKVFVQFTLFNKDPNKFTVLSDSPLDDALMVDMMNCSAAALETGRTNTELDATEDAS